MMRNGWLCTLALLAGCAQQAGNDAPRGALADAPGGPLIATVNGEAITEPLLVVFAKGRGLDPANAAQRQQALDALIEITLLAQDALTNGVAARDEVKAEVALVRAQQLSGRALSEQRRALQIDDAQMQKLYDAEAARAGDREFRVDHILFADQGSADAVVQRALQPGADFAALVTEYTPTALQAKTLEWSNATQLPPELVEVVKQLQDGQVAPVSVQTRFGWHVVRLAESRPFAPPPLDQVRDGVRKQIADNALKDYVGGLRTKATIVTAAGASAPAAPAEPAKTP